MIDNFTHLTIKLDKTDIHDIVQAKTFYLSRYIGKIDTRLTALTVIVIGVGGFALREIKVLKERVAALEKEKGAEEKES